MNIRRFTVITTADRIPEIPPGHIVMNASRPLRGEDITGEVPMIGITALVSTADVGTIRANHNLDAAVVTFVVKSTAETTIWHALADEYGVAAVSMLTQDELLTSAQSVYGVHDDHKVRVIG